MSNEQIKLFENSPIRNCWDDDAEEWFFCILDIVQALTDTKDVRQYVKRMRQREPELNSVWGTICTPHRFLSSDGKMHSVNCSNVAGILRIIMAIPSPKAEPFKRWLSQASNHHCLLKDMKTTQTRLLFVNRQNEMSLS